MVNAASVELSAIRSLIGFADSVQACSDGGSDGVSMEAKSVELSAIPGLIGVADNVQACSGGT